jgi:hypothetical protein
MPVVVVPVLAGTKMGDQVLPQADPVVVRALTIRLQVSSEAQRQLRAAVTPVEIRPIRWTYLEIQTVVVVPAVPEHKVVLVIKMPRLEEACRTVARV